MKLSGIVVSGGRYPPIIHMWRYPSSKNPLCRGNMSLGFRADRGATDFSTNLSAGRGQQTRMKHNKRKTYYAKHS
jgi:hypothetical protein